MRPANQIWLQCNGLVPTQKYPHVCSVLIIDLCQLMYDLQSCMELEAAQVCLVTSVVYCYSGQSWSFDVVGWEGNPLFCSDPWLMWDIWEASQAYCKPQWHGGDGWFTRVGWGKTCTWFICGIQTFSDIEGLVWDCSISSISSALAMGILQCCTKPLVWYEALSPFIIWLWMNQCVIHKIQISCNINIMYANTIQ